MKPYIYTPSWTQDLEDAIDSHPARVMAEELFFRFGLRAIAVAPSNSEQVTEGNTSIFMTLDGLPYCEVYITHVPKYKNGGMETELRYCFYSQYYRKDRGSSQMDRRTLYSTKLSSLMKTLETKDVIPGGITERILTNYTVDDVAGTIRNTYGRTSSKYSGSVGTDLIQALLELSIDKKPLTDTQLYESKLILDKWKQSDENQSKLSEQLNGLLGKETYVIGESQLGTTIGSIMVTKFEEDRVREFEVVKPFIGIKSLDDCEYADELRPVMTMYKLHLEQLEQANTHEPKYNTALSYASREYYKDLGIITTYDGYPINNSYHPLWTFIFKDA